MCIFSFILFSLQLTSSFAGCFFPYTFIGSSSTRAKSPVLALEFDPTILAANFNFNRDQIRVRDIFSRILQDYKYSKVLLERLYLYKRTTLFFIFNPKYPNSNIQTLISIKCPQLTTRSRTQGISCCLVSHARTTLTCMSKEKSSGDSWGKGCVIGF